MWSTVVIGVRSQGSVRRTPKSRVKNKLSPGKVCSRILHFWALRRIVAGSVHDEPIFQVVILTFWLTNVNAGTHIRLY